MPFDHCNKLKCVFVANYMSVDIVGGPMAETKQFFMLG